MTEKTTIDTETVTVNGNTYNANRCLIAPPIIISASLNGNEGNDGSFTGNPNQNGGTGGGVGSVGGINEQQQFMVCDPTAAAAQAEHARLRETQRVVPFTENNNAFLSQYYNKETTPPVVVASDDNDEDKPRCLVCVRILNLQKKFATVTTPRDTITGKWKVNTFANCGPACAKTFIMNNYGHRANRIYSYQTEMQQEIYGICDVILPAPNPKLLKCHLGPLSRADYDKVLFDQFIVLDIMDEWFYPLPMKTVATQVHGPPGLVQNIPLSGSPASSLISNISSSSSSSSTTIPSSASMSSQSSSSSSSNPAGNETEFVIAPINTVMAQTIDSTLPQEHPDNHITGELNEDRIKEAASASKKRKLQTTTSSESVVCKKSMTDFFGSVIIDPIDSR